MSPLHVSPASTASFAQEVLWEHEQLGAVVDLQQT
jgi:hypothetical protein